jgi:hypothetical protein
MGHSVLRLAKRCYKSVKKRILAPFPDFVESRASPPGRRADGQVGTRAEALTQNRNLFRVGSDLGTSNEVLAMAAPPGLRWGNAAIDEGLYQNLLFYFWCHDRDFTI